MGDGLSPLCLVGLQLESPKIETVVPGRGTQLPDLTVLKCSVSGERRDR